MPKTHFHENNCRYCKLLFCNTLKIIPSYFKRFCYYLLENYISHFFWLAKVLSNFPVGQDIMVNQIGWFGIEKEKKNNQSWFLFYFARNLLAKKVY